MNMHCTTSAWCLAVGLFLMAGVALAQVPLGTSFTYQGQLKQNGSPANGAYDLEFNLHSAAAAAPGTLIGTSTRCAVAVANGLFSVDLDFGDVFGSDALWLEIGVAAAGVCDASTTYSYLTPLQRLTPTPFALSSVRAGVAGDADRLEGHDAGDFLLTTGGVIEGDLDISRSGATPRLRIQKQDAGGEADLVFELGGNAMYNYYDGSRLRWFNPSFGDLMTMTNNGNVGIGTATPTSRLHLIGNSSPWTLRVEGVDSLFLVDSGGSAAPGDRVAQIGNGAGTEFVVVGDGSVGIAGGNPQAKLDVHGNMAFDDQKACVAIGTFPLNTEPPLSYTDRILTLVPATWSAATCAAYSQAFFSGAASSSYRLACIFRTTSSVATTQGTVPPINCGW